MKVGRLGTSEEAGSHHHFFEPRFTTIDVACDERLVVGEIPQLAFLNG